MATVETRRLTKRFDSGNAVDGIDLSVREGEFLVLVGPSGCGKTTLLRMLAGLDTPSSGDVLIGGRVVTWLPPRKRDIAMVFQSYALYPHLTVFGNIAFPMRAAGVARADVATRVQKAASMFGIERLLQRKPRQLSGGERQRVALARAVVRDPVVFLLDEPLSNLDAKLRTSARDELQQFQRRLGTTTVYVTHDQVEAMTLGRRVAVMRDGHILQVDTPQALYASPVNLFVAAFIGSPAMNLVEADVGDGVVSFAGFRLPTSFAGSQRVIAGIRPEAFEDARFADPSLPQIEVTVQVVEDLGADAHVIFQIDAPPVDVSEVREAAGDEESLIATDRATFTARVDPQTSAQVGRPLRLAVDPTKFHYFDPATGLRLEAERLAPALSTTA